MRLEELRVEFAKPICICKSCPSYPKDKVAFCRAGESDREVERVYCICYRCWIYRTEGLKGDFFCIHGKAKEDIWDKIRKKRED